MINTRVLKKLGFTTVQTDSGQYRLLSPDGYTYSLYSWINEDDAWADGPNLLSYHNLQMLFNYLINYDYDIQKRNNIYFVKFLHNSNPHVGYDLATVICEAYIDE